MARGVRELFIHDSGVSLIAPKEQGAGKVEIQIDGQTRSTADLSTASARLAEQVMCELTSLNPGKHSIAIVNRGPGPVAVDALIVRSPHKFPAELLSALAIDCALSRQYLLL